MIVITTEVGIHYSYYLSTRAAIFVAQYFSASAPSYVPSVLHTLAYLKGTFPLGLKGRFYAKLVFVSKGKILRHCCLYVLNGKILRQKNHIKPSTCAHICDQA